MKRYLCIILTVLTLFLLAGCTEDPEFDKPVSFYYPAQIISYDTADGVIRAEVREGKDYENDATGLIRLYLEGPVSAEYIDPFPEDVTLRSLSVMENEVIIELSSQFASLTGLEHTLAVSSIAKTLYELTDTPKVTIITEGIVEPLVLTTDNLLFSDDETVPETTEE